MDKQEGVGLLLIVQKKDEEVGRIELFPGSNLVGRWDKDVSSFPEVDLEKYDSDCEVSRKHALIDIANDKITLEDLGSLNGTYLNGARLDGSVPLICGDVISIGKIELRLIKQAD